MKVYEIITNRIIEKLEAGIIPWHKPWQSVEGTMILATSIGEEILSGFSEIIIFN